MRTYVVRQGDHLEQLAFALGFDATVVWSHPKNEDLRKKRKYPSVLCPGDVLFIPDEAARPWLDLKKGEANRFVARIPKIETHLQLVDVDGPLANEEFTLEGATPSGGTTTDDQGRLSFVAPITARRVRIVLKNHGALDLMLGDMDPISELVGVQKRLRSLGCFWGEPSGELDEATRYAIKRFQERSGLEITGELTPETEDALEKAHGC